MMEEKKQEDAGWRAAVELLCRWERGDRHLDDLLEQTALGRVRWLVMEAFRHWLVVERILAPRLRRPPRPQARQLLRLAVTECLCRAPDTHPRIVHHTVELAGELGLSRPECGFINGVLRGLLREWGEAGAGSTADTHPEWQVRRWRRQFGEDGTAALLQWNQAQPALTVQAAACPDYAEPTRWDGFFTVKPQRFSEAAADLAEGRVYVQDPFTRLPVELLAVQPGETVIDFCAAPGGKTRLLAEALQGRGSMLAVDKPGRRLKRLHENVARMAPGLVQVAGGLVEALDESQLPPPFRKGTVDAVLIDVPCSNTGVIQKRPDVKLRLSEADIGRLADRQLELLQAAAEWVRPGGRLVYSTCSLEHEENAGVVGRLLAANPCWRLQAERISLPWECGHDGGGAFLLTKQAGG